MLKDHVILKVPNGMDRWQNTTYTDYEVSNVHLQSDNKTIISINNSEVQLTGTLFIDGKRSLPLLNIDDLQKQAHDNNGTMRAVVFNASGEEIGNFNVLIVDGLPDVPATRIHHWELGLQ